MARTGALDKGHWRNFIEWLLNEEQTFKKTSRLLTEVLLQPLTRLNLDL